MIHPTGERSLTCECYDQMFFRLIVKRSFAVVDELLDRRVVIYRSGDVITRRL